MAEKVLTDIEVLEIA